VPVTASCTRELSRETNRNLQPLHQHQHQHDDHQHSPGPSTRSATNQPCFSSGRKRSVSRSEFGAPPSLGKRRQSAGEGTAAAEAAAASFAPSLLLAPTPLSLPSAPAPAPAAAGLRGTSGKSNSVLCWKVSVSSGHVMPLSALHAKRHGCSAPSSMARPMLRCQFINTIQHSLPSSAQSKSSSPRRHNHPPSPPPATASHEFTPRARWRDGSRHDTKAGRKAPAWPLTHVLPDQQATRVTRTINARGYEHNNKENNERDGTKRQQASHTSHAAIAPTRAPHPAGFPAPP
jgi:hypothetical protein